MTNQDKGARIQELIIMRDMGDIKVQNEIDALYDSLKFDESSNLDQDNLMARMG